MRCFMGRRITSGGKGWRWIHGWETRMKINSFRALFLCISACLVILNTREWHRVLLLNFLHSLDTWQNDILTSPTPAHKMHILEIKRKFVSYLLCSMGIFFSLRFFCWQYNKEEKFIPFPRRKSRHQRQKKTIYSRRNKFSIRVYVERDVYLWMH